MTTIKVFNFAVFVNSLQQQRNRQCSSSTQRKVLSCTSVLKVMLEQGTALHEGQYLDFWCYDVTLEKLGQVCMTISWT